MKLMPPRTVWITENQGYPHDMRVKVSRVRGGRGTWPDAISVSVRPDCAEIAVVEEIVRGQRKTALEGDPEPQTIAEPRARFLAD